MYSPKKINFTTVASYIFFFKKIILSIMYMPVFNFQNMVDMHKSMHIKFSSILFNKKLTTIA
jgi:hypothetical protein